MLWRATAFLVLQETKGLICPATMELKCSRSQLLALSLFQKLLFAQWVRLYPRADLLLSRWRFQLCLFACSNTNLNVNTLIA